MCRILYLLIFSIDNEVILMNNLLRNSSSSDEEQRHTPSPPGANSHRIKRLFFLVTLTIITWTVTTISLLPGLFLGRLTTRNSYALLEKNWRKQRQRQLTDGRFPMKCSFSFSCQFFLAKSIFFAGNLTLIHWKAGTAGRRPFRALFPCPTSRWSS